MLTPSHVSSARARGFSLVELLVAMVLGLIVIGAVIALVLSMMRANNQTISATRLTQELRAVAALMAADIRRAGSVQDPLTAATADAGDPENPYATVSTGTAGCIRYGYADAEGGDYHSIFLSGGAVYLKASGTQANADCSAGSGDPALSSPQVTVTALTFSQTGRRIDITLAGRLTNNADITRSYTQSVFVRSVPGT